MSLYPMYIKGLCVRASGDKIVLSICFLIGYIIISDRL